MRQENFQDIQAAMRVAFESYPIYVINALIS